MRLSLSSLLIVTGLVLSLVSHAQAQAPEDETVKRPAKSPKMAIGFSLETIQDDFGLDVDLTTPYFAGEMMAVRLRGGIAWANGIADGETEETWLLYTPLRIALVGSWTFAADTIRLYSEAGGIVILSIQDVSADTFSGIGGYGLFGFEFFSGDHVPVTYFIEGGGMGTSAVADKMLADPSLANGFFASVGLRWYL